jgi:alkylated DNA repair protein alkB family protein 8
MTKYPDGLIYIDNFIDSIYAEKILDFVCKDIESPSIRELKKRKVKHYGYEFRYGTNDCDEDQKLNDPSNRLPTELLRELFDKMIDKKLISKEPDQLTVNIYEPGNGIAPHIDNTEAFDDYIISLSLLSSCTMDFRLKEHKKMAKIRLKPNSLLVLKGKLVF